MGFIPIFQLFEQLSDRFPQHRMAVVAHPFAQGDEHEFALLDQRMGNGQPLGANHAVVVEEYVDVDRARRISGTGPLFERLFCLAVAPQFPLDRL